MVITLLQFFIFFVQYDKSAIAERDYRCGEVNIKLLITVNKINIAVSTNYLCAYDARRITKTGQAVINGYMAKGKNGKIEQLTVKPIPTVAENDPVWNFPWSNCTSSDVLPTPLSPTNIV